MSVPAKRGRAPRASKSKAKAKVKALDSSEDELMLKSESEEEDEDFAMNSEDEEKQVTQAIKASKKSARASTSSAGTSSAASSTGKARGGRAVKKGTLLRTAAAKAKSRTFAITTQRETLIGRTSHCGFRIVRLRICV